jgi:hypothetical protein
MDNFQAPFYGIIDIVKSFLQIPSQRDAAGDGGTLHNKPSIFTFADQNFEIHL